MPKEVPVYLFLGFLDAGKTKFIQETFEDERFDSGEKTLLLVCEEGEEEYAPSRFAVKKHAVSVVDEKGLTLQNLKRLARESGAERVVIEWNGMLTLDKLFDAMPDGWLIAQVMAFFDATTFLSYNTNMRQLVYDKIQYADMVVFNRFRPEMSKEEFHKIVRAVSRRLDIVYEYMGGRAEYDDIEDALPFDINAPVIEIEDRDFAYFYRDLHEESAKYDGKTVRFKGFVVEDRKMKAGTIGVGRYIMTCCAADIAYNGLICVGDPSMPFKLQDWVIVTARIDLEYHPLYGEQGPVLKIFTIERCSPLSQEEEVATFY